MMCWYLALKRQLRPGTILLWLLTMACILGGAGAGRQATLRPCGLVCEDPDGQQIVQQLTAHNFAVYADRETMTADIAAGELDCGAVLLKGLTEHARKNEPRRAVLILTAPDAFLTEVYEAHIQSVLYRLSAPARTVQAAREAGVELDPEKVSADLDAMFAAGYRFTFDRQTVDGGIPTGDALGTALSQAAAALLLFAGIVPYLRQAVQDADTASRRIGRQKARKHLLLPAAVVRPVLFLPGALLLGKSAPGAIGYLLLLTAMGLAAGLIRLRRSVLLPAVLLGSLALYPAYMDAAQVLPWLRYVRIFLPPCWLPTAIAYPAAALSAGAVLCVTAMILYPMRRKP